MRFRECTMNNARYTIGKRRFCRGELRSPARGFVILNKAKNLSSVILNVVKNLGSLVEVGEGCE